MIIKIFPIEYGKMKFHLDNKYNYRNEIKYIDWKQNDIIKNNANLQQQLIVNVVNVQLIETNCKHKNPIIPFIISNNTGHDYDPSDPNDNIYNYIIQYKYDIDKCQKFLNQTHDIYEVLSRDTDASLHYQQGKKFNIKLYAVVLFDDNYKYYGHIYTWISPKNPKLALALGIRARIDSLFMPEEQKIKNISSYLLEGVRHFAFTNNCNQLLISQPLPVMRNILTKLGFEINKTEKKENQGISIAYYVDCNDPPFCYTKNVEEKIPTNNEIKYEILL